MNHVSGSTSLRRGPARRLARCIHVRVGESQKSRRDALRLRSGQAGAAKIESANQLELEACAELRGERSCAGSQLIERAKPGRVVRIRYCREWRADDVCK